MKFRDAALSIAVSVIFDLILLWLYLFRTFTWGDGSLARFMLWGWAEFDLGQTSMNYWVTSPYRLVWFEDRRVKDEWGTEKNWTRDIWERRRAKQAAELFQLMILELLGAGPTHP
jgi:hypothetical protein